ncbi:DUF4229 domain-containing protein [Tersicoccus sp. Bi-70]|uniref:DUF4229 domain-containing protein n=1 Tax=Tersicoccus sp. Bi-70 TaxID=1897634 RepID=UPI0009769BF4|nr:DUF4229 domain-containing protein [Tersicoccus sp. Bi-70]OMH34456.1 hypothetical protein BGP79_05010 [Tersicoccus sp. Bi-70]
MALLKYSAARLGLVVLIFVLGLLLHLGVVMSMIVALVASFCISYLFFGRMRDAAASQVGNRITGRTGRRSRTELDDAAAEDSYWDDHEQTAEPAEWTAGTDARAQGSTAVGTDPHSGTTHGADDGAVRHDAGRDDAGRADAVQDDSVQRRRGA